MLSEYLTYIPVVSGDAGGGVHAYLCSHDPWAAAILNLPIIGKDPTSQMRALCIPLVVHNLVTTPPKSHRVLAGNAGEAARHLTEATEGDDREIFR